MNKLSVTPDEAPAPVVSESKAVEAIKALADLVSAHARLRAITNTPPPPPVVHPISAEHPPKPGDRVEFASGLQAVVRRVVDSPKHPNEICEVEAGSPKQSWLCEARTFRRIAHAPVVHEISAGHPLVVGDRVRHNRTGETATVTRVSEEGWAEAVFRAGTGWWWKSSDGFSSYVRPGLFVTRIAHAGQVPEQLQPQLADLVEEANRVAQRQRELASCTNAELMAELAKRLEGGAA